MAPRGEKLGPRRQCSVDLEGFLLGNSNKLKSEKNIDQKRSNCSYSTRIKSYKYIYIHLNKVG